jgi:kynurenine formamidase
MRIRSFIIAYALVLAIILFADRRHSPAPDGNRYSHVIDLTSNDLTGNALTGNSAGREKSADSLTHIIAPDSIIPGTWTAAQIPPERLIAPLVVMDLNVAPPAQISLDDIAAWETKHGAVPQGAVVAIRQTSSKSQTSAPPQQVPHQTSASVGPNAAPDPSSSAFPITDQAAQFLMDARYTTGFAIDQSSDLQSDRVLARQIALHGNYVVEGASRLAAIPATGSLIIVAPARNAPAKDKLHAAPVRVLAMVR